MPSCRAAQRFWSGLPASFLISAQSLLGSSQRRRNSTHHPPCRHTLDKQNDDLAIVDEWAGRVAVPAPTSAAVTAAGWTPQTIYRANPTRRALRPAQRHAGVYPGT
jgi:hypothetical protein